MLLLLPKKGFILAFFLLLSTTTTNAIEIVDNNNSCGCTDVEIVSTKDDVIKKHNNLLGKYQLLQNAVNHRPSYKHESGKYFLYYNSQSQGFWAVTETIQSDVVRLENQGDQFCPYSMKSLWRFADGNIKGLRNRNLSQSI